MTLGEKIYKLRTKRSMTQEQLAEKIGVSRQSVSKWETDSAIPDIEKLKLLAEIFEVSITELLGMECEEDTKRKDEKERIEHCQKEIKRWKRYAIVLIAISAVLPAALLPALDGSFPSGSWGSRITSTISSTGHCKILQNTSRVWVETCIFFFIRPIWPALIL